MGKEHPQRGWGQWFAAQWALFVVFGIVSGFGFWVAGQALIIGIMVGCLAFAVGCVIGLTRLERWLEARDESR